MKRIRVSLTLGSRALLITLLSMTLSAGANPQAAAPPGGGSGGTTAAQVWNTYLPLLSFPTLPQLSLPTPRSP